MKNLVYAIAAMALATSAAYADPVTPSTITGYAASVAVARGVPLNGSENAALNRQAPQFRQAAADGGRAYQPVSLVTNQRAAGAR